MPILLRSVAWARRRRLIYGAIALVSALLYGWALVVTHDAFGNPKSVILMLAWSLATLLSFGGCVVEQGVKRKSARAPDGSRVGHELIVQNLHS
jgi:hypothetical protein